MFGNQNENMGQSSQREIFDFLVILQKHRQHKPHLLCNISTVNTDKSETSPKKQTEMQCAMTNFQQILWRSQISSICAITSILMPGIGPQLWDENKS